MKIVYEIKLYGRTEYNGKIGVQYIPRDVDNDALRIAGEIQSFFVDSLAEVRPTPAEMERDGE